MSDPSVAKMTEAQWLFEYHALTDRHTSVVDMIIETLKIFFAGLRSTLISVLGLNLIKRWPQTEGLTDEERAARDKESPFVPAAFIFGRPEVLKTLITKDEEADATNAALNDAAFEEFSAKLARGETADMDPILTGDVLDDPEIRKNRQLRELRAAGVKLAQRNGPASSVIVRGKV